MTVLVQVGGGGLAAGVAAAMKQRAPQTRIVVVEPSGSPKLTLARRADEPVTIPADPGGLADALLSVRIGTNTFEHLQAFADDVVTVDDSALANAAKFLLEHQKLRVEPSGAITVAALLEGVVQPSSPVVCVLSGGNVDWPGLNRVLD